MIRSVGDTCDDCGAMPWHWCSSNCVSTEFVPIGMIPKQFVEQPRLGAAIVRGIERLADRLASTPPFSLIDRALRSHVRPKE